jgi:hypothetical protein
LIMIARIQSGNLDSIVIPALSRDPLRSRTCG